MRASLSAAASPANFRSRTVAGASGGGGGAGPPHAIGGVLHDEAIEAAPLEFRAQRRKAGRARFAFACVLERLKAGLEHGGQSIDGALAGQPERTQGLP